MRISSRLSLANIIILGVLGIMILAVLWTSQEAKNAYRDELLIIEIDRTFNQMSVLRDEYLLRQEERARIQWSAKTEHIKKLLEQSEKQMTDIHEQIILDEIRRNLDLNIFLFPSLTEYFNKTENIEKRFFSLESQRMISQIIVNGYNLASAISNLRGSVQKRSIAVQEKTTILVIVLMVLAVLLTVGNSLSINRTLSKRIAALSEGAQIIGNGNLDHQISVDGNDELAVLASANNEMALKLKKSHTSLEILEKEIAERKCMEAKIQASLLEKETMLKEIHHRVKNNLQVITSLLNMQSSYLQDETAIEALQDSMERVRAMAMIHTQLYQSQDLNRVNCDLFIRDLIGNISQSYGRAESPVEINVDADEISLGIDTSIPCGLILNELVSNALKHAFPEDKGGKINIRIRLEGSQVALTVQDNGIGFPESIDLTKLKSIGLQLVNILVRQMNGKIAMQVEHGTTWTITFPVKNEREWRNG
jgi:two-component sensor histidine kinase/HAMP domain-containing protein